MKKFLLSTLLAAFALSAAAKDFEYQGINYTVLDEAARTCTVKAGNWTGPSNNVIGSLIIPDSVSDGSTYYHVIAIGDYAFINCTELTNVTIPYSVATIGRNAFTRCKSLTEISLPNTMTEIAIGTFIECTSLSSVTLPNLITKIGTSAFNACSALKEISLPNSVTTIGEYAFQNCTGLTSVTIPNSVTAIGNGAFSGCTGLTSIEIPNSVTEFGERAFGRCLSLTRAKILASVETLGNSIFDSCSNLAEIYYAAENPVAAASICPDNVYATATLYVPEAALDKIASVAYWNKFKNVRAYDFSGIDDVKSDIDMTLPVEVYSLSGVRIASGIDSLPAGIYIVRQGTKTRKIAIK